MFAAGTQRTEKHIVQEIHQMVRVGAMRSAMSRPPLCVLALYRDGATLKWAVVRAGSPHANDGNQWAGDAVSVDNSVGRNVGVANDTVCELIDWFKRH